MSSRGNAARPERPDQAFRSILDVLDARARDGDAAPTMMFFHDQSAPIAASARDAWSWRELRQRVAAIAAELASKADPGARILLVYPAGLGFVAAFFGCLYAGMVPVPVPPPRRAEGLGRWRHVASDAGISGVLAPAELLPALAPLSEAVAGVGFCLAPRDADPAQPPSGVGDALTRIHPAAADLAFLQYTSGSTSEPKGVMISHGNMMANLRQISLGYELSPADRMASWLPHYHDMGLIGTILAAVHDGFQVAFIAPASFLRRPLRWLELATHIRATMFGGPNFAFEHCMRRATPEALAELDLGTIRIAFTGAEPIRPRTLARFAETFAPCGFRWETFHACYGMAEATLFVSGNQPAEPPYLLSVDREALVLRGRAEQPLSGVAPGEEARSDLTGCGRPVAGLSLAIVDPATGQRRSDGAVGEIWIEGPNISAGYWRRPEQNAATFGQVLDGAPGWFRSGDLGFLHDGQLYVTGRLKDVIIIRGENHYPQDIEDTAAIAHPALANGNAGAVAMEIAGEERLGIVCEISREALRGLDAAAVFEALRGAISRRHDLQLATALLIRPGSLPRTPSGKVQRFACRKALTEDTLPAVARWEAQLDSDGAAGPEEERWLDSLAALPRARREDALRVLLQAELGRLAGLPSGELPSADAGFFDLGLDSVAVVNFGAVLERELGFTPAPTLMFEHPTLATLAAHLAATVLAAPPSPADQLPHRPVERPETTALSASVAAEIAALRRLLDGDPTRPTPRRPALAGSAPHLPAK